MPLLSIISGPDSNMMTIINSVFMEMVVFIFYAVLPVIVEID